jgi:hypothetical protein
MKFQIILPKSVQKELGRLPDEMANRILARLSALETNPRPADVKKLKGRDAWRIRVALLIWRFKRANSGMERCLSLRLAPSRRLKG